MAGTVTITESASTQAELYAIPKTTTIQFAWLSDGAGVVSGTATTLKYTGEIVSCVCKPGGTTPSDNYTTTLLDENSVDVLGLLGVNCKAALGTSVPKTKFVPLVNSTIQPVLSATGITKTGTIYLTLLLERP